MSLSADWLLLSLASALLLGVYDLFKKHAVNGNAVLPVLFFSCLAAALVWLGLLLAAPLLPTALQTQPLSATDHLLLFAKSSLVGTSWIFAYFGLKHLPVSVAGPIRATSPLWTLAGAVLLFSERPSLQQWLGILLAIGAFYAFSLAGRREGLHFHKNRWVFFTIAATLLGASSALYDRWLLGFHGFTPPTVQAWFHFYLVVFFLPFLYGWYRQWWPTGTFTFRWSIPAIGVGLLLTDFLYFTALHDPDAMVSLVSALRRASVLVTFVGGFLFFGDTNFRAKLLPTLGILAGVLLIVA